MEKMRFLDV
jgi:hypothetical protein